MRSVTLIHQRQSPAMPSSSRRGESASEPRQTCANPATSLCTEPRPSSSTDAASPATSTSSTRRSAGSASTTSSGYTKNSVTSHPQSTNSSTERKEKTLRSGAPGRQAARLRSASKRTCRPDNRASIKPGCGSVPAARGLSSVQFSSGRGPTNSTPYSSQAFSICDPSTDSSGGRPPDREGRVMAR